MSGRLLDNSIAGGRIHRRHGRYRPMADINITPMVDVMLVLLIVFMVTAPLLTVGVPVDLPSTNAARINDSEPPMVITLNKKGEVFIQETLTPIDALIPKLEAISKNNKNMRIFIRGDAHLPYGRIMDLMGRISASGFKKVALLAKSPQDQASPSSVQQQK